VSPPILSRARSADVRSLDHAGVGSGAVEPDLPARGARLSLVVGGTGCTALKRMFVGLGRETAGPSPVAVSFFRLMVEACDATRIRCAERIRWSGLARGPLSGQVRPYARPIVRPSHPGRSPIRCQYYFLSVLEKLDGRANKQRVPGVGICRSRSRSAHGWGIGRRTPKGAGESRVISEDRGYAQSGSDISMQERHTRRIQRGSGRSREESA
jgi:hypothetical protein